MNSAGDKLANVLQLWQKCQKNLQQQLSAQEYNTWIFPLGLHENCQSGLLQLIAPNAYIQSFVRDRYLTTIAENMHRLLGSSPKKWRVQIEVRSPSTHPVPPTGNGAQPAIHSNGHSNGHANGHFDGRGESVAAALQPDGNAAPPPLKSSRPRSNGKANGMAGISSASLATRSLNTAYTLDSFVKGDSNQMAHAAACSVIEHYGRISHNPLVFYGGVGLGKTHLMHAVGNALQRKSPNCRVVYFSSEDFVNRLVRAIRTQAMDDFRRHYRDAVDVLLIDDVQFFADKDASATEAFNTIDTLSETGRQIIITCDRFPGDLGDMEARLRSRIGRGLSVPIEAPDLETRAAILMHKALSAGEALAEDIALFIARQIDSNVRELEGALNRVIAGARFSGCPINMEITRRALADVMARNGRGPTIRNIKKKIADYFRIRMNDLDNASRKAIYVHPRQMAMSLARDLTSHSLPQIGENFGGRDHTTVLYACNKIRGLRMEDAECAADYNRLRRELSE